MRFFKENFAVIASGAVAVIFVLFLVLGESWFLSSSNVVKALSDNIENNIYPIAVSSLLEQSNYFSSWAIALIVSGWFVMIHEKPAPGSIILLFVTLCCCVVFVLFLGQVIHQLVIDDIRQGADPLDDKLIWTNVTRQYWSLILSGCLVVAAVIWRFAVEKAN